MSIATRRAKSRLGATAIAAVAAATIVPVAHATLTVNLSFANGTTSMALTTANTNTDVPVYVYATVTGTSAPTAPGAAGTTSMTPPSGTGEFDGLQYLYYNIANSTTGTAVAGGLDATTPAVLNAALGFNGTGMQPTPTPTVGSSVGAQVGTLQTTGGVLLGSLAAPTATTITDVAKPRSNSAVFQNYATFNQTAGTYTTVGASAGTTLNGSSIVISGNSVSFLVETLNFKPSAFTSGATTTLAPSIPTLPSPYFGANWFQDNTSVTAGMQPTNTSNGLYTAGSSVTFTSGAATGPSKGYLFGDINGDGFVNADDFKIFAANFNKQVTAYTGGDLNGDGFVNADDFKIFSADFNKAAPSAVVAEDEAELDALATTIGVPAPFAAVPEPATLGVFGVVSATALLRRKSRVN